MEHATILKLDDHAKAKSIIYKIMHIKDSSYCTDHTSYIHPLKLSLTK